MTREARHRDRQGARGAQSACEALDEALGALRWATTDADATRRRREVRLAQAEELLFCAERALEGGPASLVLLRAELELWRTRRRLRGGDDLRHAQRDIDQIERTLPRLRRVAGEHG